MYDFNILLTIDWYKRKYQLRNQENALEICWWLLHLVQNIIQKCYSKSPNKIFFIVSNNLFAIHYYESSSIFARKRKLKSCLEIA